MWTALRSDLMDFVTTIADDTTKTINKVIGESVEEDEELSLREKMTTDLKRSYNTYGTPVEEQYYAQYEKFLKKFSLSSQASDIAELLDAEIDVSRYYAELVPSQVKPEDFWARYFFRLLLLSKEGAVNLDDDDDEELLWETNDNGGDKEESKGSTPLYAVLRKEAPESDDVKAKAMRDRIISLEGENVRLKGMVKTLAGRVTELEKELALRDQIPSPSPFNQVLPVRAVTMTPANEVKDERATAQSMPNITRKAVAGVTEGAGQPTESDAAPTYERAMRRALAQEPLTATASAIARAPSSSVPPFPLPLPLEETSSTSSFKPITAGSSTAASVSASVAQQGTRLSLNTGTTLATESSTNTGSVSPLTEVTEAFIRRAQRASFQSANNLSNINCSANVSICTSEQEQSTYLNNNDLHSETASEDSGVLVAPEKATSTASSSVRKGRGETGGMEMSSLNLITSFDSVVGESPGSLPSTNPAIASEPVKSIPKISNPPVELAALDGDEEEDDGWS